MEIESGQQVYLKVEHYIKGKTPLIWEGTGTNKNNIAPNSHGNLKALALDVEDRLDLYVMGIQNNVPFKSYTKRALGQRIDIEIEITCKQRTIFRVLRDVELPYNITANKFPIFTEIDC